MSTFVNGFLTVPKRREAVASIFSPLNKYKKGSEYEFISPKRKLTRINIKRLQTQKGRAHLTRRISFITTKKESIHSMFRNRNWERFDPSRGIKRKPEKKTRKEIPHTFSQSKKITPRHNPVRDLKIVLRKRAKTKWPRFKSEA